MTDMGFFTALLGVATLVIVSAIRALNANKQKQHALAVWTRRTRRRVRQR